MTADPASALRVGWVTVLGLALVIGAAACGSGGAGRTKVAAPNAATGGGVAAPSPEGATVDGMVGPLQVVGAYLPQPASPAVAAVYLTVRNTGATADRLVGISSTDAAASMLMSEDDQGSSGTMSRLTDITIPAHGSATLTPGHDHAMLEGPPANLVVGQRVPLTLRFATAGSVTVQVPVVALSAVAGQGSGS